jgi:tetratricopeptide (TPR) repeat protein
MRPSRPSVVLLGLLSIGVARAASEPTLPQFQRASGLCLNAERAMRRGNLKSAQSQLEQAVQVLPIFPAAHMGLGHVALSERRYDDALREYRAARDSYALAVHALVALKADLYLDSRLWIVAIQDEVRRETLTLYMPLRASRLAHAADQLQRLDPPNHLAIEEPPAEIDAYIGNALFHLGRVPEAVAAWKSSLQRDSRSEMAWQNLAVGYWTIGRIDDAVRAVAAADGLGLHLDPAMKADLMAASQGRIR